MDSSWLPKDSRGWGEKPDLIIPGKVSGKRREIQKRKIGKTVSFVLVRSASSAGGGGKSKEGTRLSRRKIPSPLKCLHQDGSKTRGAHARLGAPQ